MCTYHSLTDLPKAGAITWAGEGLDHNLPCFQTQLSFRAETLHFLNSDVYDGSRCWASVPSPSWRRWQRLLLPLINTCLFQGGSGGYWLHSRCRCVNQSLDSNKNGSWANVIARTAHLLTAIVFHADTSQVRSGFKTFFLLPFFLKMRGNYNFHLNTRNTRRICFNPKQLVRLAYLKEVTLSCFHSRKVGQSSVIYKIWKNLLGYEH